MQITGVTSISGVLDVVVVVVVNGMKVFVLLSKRMFAFRFKL